MSHGSLYLTVVMVAQQYLAHKGEDADSFFIILRGEAQECARLTINETAETR